MKTLQHVLTARNLKDAVCQSIPLEPGIDSQWIYFLRLYLATIVIRVRLHSRATPERFQSVLFEIPNAAVIALVRHSTIGEHMAGWDPLMISTLRRCLKAVLEGADQRAAKPSVPAFRSEQTTFVNNFMESLAA